MVRPEKMVIQSIPGLLEKMFCTWSSQKTRTEIFFYLADQAPRTIWLVEHFDDGRGHSGAVSEDETALAEEVFNEALRESYICQVPGHGSRVRFLLTSHGEEEYWRLKELSEKATKKQRTRT